MHTIKLTLEKFKALVEAYDTVRFRYVDHIDELKKSLVGLRIVKQPGRIAKFFGAKTREYSIHEFVRGYETSQYRRPKPDMTEQEIIEEVTEYWLENFKVGWNDDDVYTYVLYWSEGYWKVDTAIALGMGRRFYKTMKAAHNEFKGTVDEKPRFDVFKTVCKALRAADRLIKTVKELDPRIENTTLSPDTVDHVADIIRWSRNSLSAQKLLGVSEDGGSADA